jgi:acyl-CoA synthetase (NDP forming)
MILTAHMLARFGACPPGGVGVVSSSGGINGIVADRLADIGAPLARLGAATKARLAEVMLPTHLDNPVDLGARRQEFGEGNAIAERVVAAVASDPDVGVVMIPLTTAPNYEAAAAALAKPLAECGKPGFFIVTPGSVATPIRAIIKQHGCPLYDRIDDAMRMLAAYRAYRPPGAADAAPRLARQPRPPLDLRPGYLTEPETKALLTRYGIPVTRERIVGSAAAAGAAATEIGFPVVLKAVTRRLVHKSDAGLVKLGLADVEAVALAYGEVTAGLQRLDPDGAVIVAEMVTGELELILGATHDPQFGATVMVGAGGVLVELLGDVEMAAAPLDRAAAEAMLRRLRIWPLLAGFRGRPALDVAAAADALSRLVELVQPPTSARG